MAKKKKTEEPKVEPLKVVTPEVKVETELFAGKLVLSKYENENGKFVVLEGGETIKV